MSSLSVAVLDLNDLYLCDGLGVGGAGLEHLHLLVDVGRVDPLGARHALRLLLRVRREEGAERTEMKGHMFTYFTQPPLDNEQGRTAELLRALLPVFVPLLSQRSTLEPFGWVDGT